MSTIVVIEISESVYLEQRTLETLIKFGFYRTGFFLLIIQLGVSLFIMVFLHLN